MAECGSCGAEIEWAVNPVSGARIPLNMAQVEPLSRGAMFRFRDEYGMVCAAGIRLASAKLARMNRVTEAQAREMLVMGGDARSSHFATCGQADQWRKRDRPNS